MYYMLFCSTVGFYTYKKSISLFLRFIVHCIIQSHEKYNNFYSHYLSVVNFTHFVQERLFVELNCKKKRAFKAI